MARVTFSGSFCAEFIGDLVALDLPATSLFHLLRLLDAQYPGLGAHLEARAAVAMNGVLVSDWTQAMAPDAEVLLLPRVAGG
jgi:molybdopterin converting factor small subunit